MTQKVFDTNNAEDMALLWSILPDWAEKIKKSSQAYNYYVFKINWHDKTEITRPIQEATEDDIGKICYFWENDETDPPEYGILQYIYTDETEKSYQLGCNGGHWEHCRRLTKQEIEELC